VGNGDELFNINYKFVNPRLGANFKINDNSSLFALVAYTHNEPRMRNLYAADDSYFGAEPLFKGRILEDGTKLYDFGNPLVKPESMFDLELGGAYKNDNYSFNINLYWMNYNDELVKSGALDIFGNPIDGNAPHTLHFGLELQASAVILKGNAGNVYVSANATFSKNKIIDYNYITSNGGVISLKDNPISGFPDAMANLQLRYTKNDFYISLLGKFVGSYRTDNYGDFLTTNNILIKDLQVARNIIQIINWILISY